MGVSHGRERRNKNKNREDAKKAAVILEAGKDKRGARNGRGKEKEAQ